MKRVTLDKIASVTLRLDLDPHAVLGEEIPAEEGTVIAARVLNAKRSYNTLEDVHGRIVENALRIHRLLVLDMTGQGPLTDADPGLDYPELSLPGVSKGA